MTTRLISGTRARLALIASAVVVAGILIAVGVQQASSGGSPTAAASAPPGAGSPFPVDHPAAKPGASPCTSVSILTSLENADTVRALASAYMAAPRDIRGHCVAVHVTADMSGVAEKEARQKFAGMMPNDRPDIWLPDSSAWLRLASAAPVVPTSGPSIGRSAVVLAMPVRLAMALGWISHSPTWAQVFRTAENPDIWKHVGHPAWGTFKVGKASPELATSGLLALTASYLAASGHTHTLDPAIVDNSAVRAKVAKSELPTAHYMSAPQQFLFHAREAEQEGSIASFLSAMFMDEKTVWDYNRGVIPTMRSMGMVGMGMGGMNMGGRAKSSSSAPMSSGSMPSTMSSGSMSTSAAPMSSSAASSPMGSGPTNDSAGGRLDPPHEKLVPIYPRDGVYVADNPAAILHGSWVSPIQAAAAADFVRFARTAQGQAIVRANGYRDIRGQTSPAVSHVALTVRNVHTLPMPNAATLSAVQSSFPSVRKPARVLFLLDVSGSMGYEIRPGTSRLAAAKSAIAAALNYFNGTDRVGLEAFSNRPGRGIRPGLVAPIKPLSTGRQSFLAALRTLHPISETPLYVAVARSADQMAATYEPDRINAVIVLSDGHNHSDLGSSKAQMLHALASVHARVPILVFTLAYGHHADTATLAAIASATGAHYFNATNPDTIKEVLADELVTSF